LYIEKGELFTTKMLELYRGYEDTLASIINDREQYLSLQDPAYEPYTKIIKTYDMYIKINGSDTDISEALHATCLWYVYKYISGDDDDPTLFLDEQEADEKGKQKAPKLNLNKLAMYLIRKYCVVSANECIYCYIDDKYYETQDRLSKDLVKILMQIGYSDHTKVKEIVNDVIYRVRHMTAKFKDFPFNKKSKFLIPVRNGVVVRRNINELLPQSPVWGFTFSLPVTFDKNADTQPIKEFLSSLVESDEDYELLIQIVAQALLQDENYQQAYLMTGGGSNGKSTYITLTTRLVGDTNITAVSLQEIIENRFSAAELQGKLLNMYPDLPKSSLKTTGKFKALTGADSITVEKKFAQPFKLRNKAVFAFSANSLPSVDDSSFAFWRRWAIIDFPFTFKVDPTLIEKLATQQNLSGYLNLVIDKMNRIEKYGLTRSNKVENAMNTWKKRSNSAYAFVTDMLEKSATDFIKYDTLYNIYINYCEEQDFTSLGKPKFTMELEKIGAILGHATEAQARIKIVKGVKLKKKILPEMKTEEETPTVF
jgi:P4 family phage/plasmid primase-like protien